MLARIRKQLEEKDQGFTLIELLVVIIIIGILAAIAIPLYLNQQNKAKDSAAKADVNTLRTALVSAITENPTATVATAAVTTAPTVAITLTLPAGGSGTTDGGTVSLSPGNSLGTCTATVATEVVNCTVTSPTGNSYSIDKTGKITETLAS